MAGHTKKLDNGKWMGRFPKGGGKYRSKTFDRKLDADRWLREQNDSRDKGDWVDPKDGKTTFAVVAGEWIEMRNHLAESTLSRDKSYLSSLILPTFGTMPVAEIRTEDVEIWISRMDVAPATQHKAMQILSGVFTRAVKTRRISVSPTVHAEGLPRIEQQEMRFLTVPEVGKLADACDVHSPLVWAAAYTGMRFSELAGLTYDNVNLEARTLTVAEVIVEVNGRLITKPPKTSSSKRSIAIPTALVEVIGEGTGLVFPSASTGGPIRRSNFRYRTWVPATEQTGLKGVRFHDLRHTSASWLIAANVHPKVISTRLGHSSITVTMDRYGHIMDGLDRDAADMLDNLRGTTEALPHLRIA